jgi:YggT family protein
MLERIVLFITSGILIFIVAVVALMIVRLITDAMDLNPFAWTSRTVRRLSDGFIVPVRGGLRGLGMDPKFAPLAVILVVILLGYYFLTLVRTIESTVAGVWVSVQSGSGFAALGYILHGLLSIYILLIIVRIVFSWARVSYSNRLMRFLVDVTEPLLGPLRRLIPPLGWIDISPIVALLILWLFQQAIEGTLLSGPFRSFLAA